MDLKQLAERIAAIEKHLGIGDDELKQVESEITKPSVGKWYIKNQYQPPFIIFVTSYDEEKDEIKGYGFFNGKWEDDLFAREDALPLFKEATPEEVKSALVDEAKTRYAGKKAKCLHGCLEFDSEKHLDSFEFDFQTFPRDATVRYVGKNGVGCIFHDGKWAEIIEQPKSILDGKIAISVHNEREFELLMKHYEEKGWDSWQGLSANECMSKWTTMPYPKNVTYCNKFDSRSDAGCYTIIQFSEFAKEIGIESTVFIMKSEDGVDLYEGDDYYRAGRSNPDATGDYKIFFGEKLKSCHFVCSYPETDKAFSTRESAEKWIAEQNKPKEIEVKLTSMVSAKITNEKVGFYLEEKSHTIQWLSSSDIAAIHNAIQQLKGGGNHTQKLDCPYDFTSRCTMGRCDCKPKS